MALISVVVAASASSSLLWIRRDSASAEPMTAPRSPRTIVEKPEPQPPPPKRGLTEAAEAAVAEIVTTTYRPGNLSVRQHGLRLSEGLSATIVARSGQPIRYVNGNWSNDLFHDQPDGAATYADSRETHNPGGWVYVSNSEVRDIGGGGVGAITLDQHGQAIHYQMLLQHTRSNCGGGKTSWGAWISGEEYPTTGRIWQVDPFNEHDPVPITMGDVNSGLFESFAYDDRNMSSPHFFMTKDDVDGALRRLYVWLLLVYHRPFALLLLLLGWIFVAYYYYYYCLVVVAHCLVVTAAVFLITHGICVLAPYSAPSFQYARRGRFCESMGTLDPTRLDRVPTTSPWQHSW
jgi:hypothetical protein